MGLVDFVCDSLGSFVFVVMTSSLSAVEFLISNINIYLRRLEDGSLKPF